MQTVQVAVIRFNGANGGYTLSGNAVTVTGGDRLPVASQPMTRI